MEWLACLIWLIVYVVVAYVMVLIFEQVLSLLGIALPAQLFTILRLLAGLIVLLLFLGCLGLVPGLGAPHLGLRR